MGLYMNIKQSVDNALNPIIKLSRLCLETFEENTPNTIAPIAEAIEPTALKEPTKSSEKPALVC
jgi:hypothetical protein